MFHDSGSWLWLLIDVFFVVLLAAGLIYGTMAWRSRRQRVADAAREHATRRLYEKEAERERRNA
jgi:hypothetical protein